MVAVAQFGQCQKHPEAAVTFSCPRCGQFGCIACENKTRPDAQPICPNCWALRSKVVVENKAHSGRLQTTSLVLGVISLAPIPAVMLASLIVGIIALVKAKTDIERANRWKPIAALCLTVASIFFWAIVLILSAGDV
jgi:predicted RNA-binding Zn-ribbon protein involved in translation (DUF1610 family)